MLTRRFAGRWRVQAPLSEGDGGAPSRVAVLDPLALQRLRDLDPNGASRLMERVVKAFDNSAARLVPLLRTAGAGADVAGIRHVAHTLKSSSASIGAVKLSQMCAEMEAMARQGVMGGMTEKIAALATEITAVLEALKHTLDSPP